MMFDIQNLARLLRDWKPMPDMPPSEFSPFSSHKDRHHRFSGEEVTRMKADLKRMSPQTYFSVFPEERVWRA
jgi:hypothetical protein